MTAEEFAKAVILLYREHSDCDPVEEGGCTLIDDLGALVATYEKKA